MARARKNYEIHMEAIEKFKNLDGITIIDPIEYLCTDICKVMDNNFNYFYKDRAHFRPWYAKESLQYLDVIFQ